MEVSREQLAKALDGDPACSRDEAVQALSASTWQYQNWGSRNGSRDELRSAQWEMDRAKVHALLDVADAIREQTRAVREQTDALQNEGVVVR